MPYLLVLWIMFWAALPSGGVIINEPSVEYTFGDKAIFQTVVNSNIPITKAILYYEGEQSIDTQVQECEVLFTGNGSYTLETQIDLSQQPLRPFSEYSYHFDVILQSGEVISGEQSNFLYTDNRYNWLSLREDQFQVHWIEGDVEFAQNVLDAAQAGSRDIQRLLPLESPQQVEIYVYPNANDYQSILSAEKQNWVAGHSDPELGIIAVTLPSSPDQYMLIEQRVPHELMHILLYLSEGDDYARLPTWLSEGLAVTAELTPNPDYRILLTNAYQNERLIPFSQLCNGFPSEASSALLAYAQSGSMIEYLVDRYGTDSLRELVSSYASGVNCQVGAEATFDRSLAELELAWRRDVFKENIFLLASQKLAPWLTVFLGVLVTPLILGLIILRKKARP